ncbi:MAG: hypothetical protein ACE5NA_04355 [Nitrospiraceae bacterium]
MSDSSDQFLQQAINTLSQSDPITKLVQEIKVGRMKATDAGLRAITDSWLATYQNILENAHALDRGALRRLDPTPRLAVLSEAGVVPADHSTVVALRSTYQSALTRAQDPT